MDMVAEKIEGKYELCQVHISTCCYLSNLWSEICLTKVKKKKEEAQFPIQ